MQEDRSLEEEVLQNRLVATERHFVGFVDRLRKTTSVTDVNLFAGLAWEELRKLGVVPAA